MNTIKVTVIRITLIANILLLGLNVFSQSISINSHGNLPDPSAMLDIQSTDKGLLVPRMTVNQRTSITNPASGLIVYQTDGAAGFYYNGGTPSSPSWVLLIAGPIEGSDIAPGIQTTTNTTIALGNNNNTAVELRWLEPSESGNHYTAFKAQPQTDNLIYTLPGTAPTENNKVLAVESVDANKVELQWATPIVAPAFARTDISVNTGNVTLDAAGKSFIRITAAPASFNLNGLTGGMDGQMLIIVNTSGKSMTIVNEDNGSSPVNRIHTSSNSNIVKLGGEVTSIFIYDGGSGRWRLI